VIRQMLFDIFIGTRHIPDRQEYTAIQKTTLFRGTVPQMLQTCRADGAWGIETYILYTTLHNIFSSGTLFILSQRCFVPTKSSRMI
jgi:hypothetical protein